MTKKEIRKEMEKRYVSNVNFLIANDNSPETRLKSIEMQLRDMSWALAAMLADD